MTYGLDIVWPLVSDIKDTHFFNTVTLHKNLNIGNNLNIKFNLTSENLIIKNNGFFNSNINIDNYILKINETLITTNTTLVNTHLIVKQNTNSDTININLKNLATKLDIGRNINVEGNVNIGLFSIGKNINCKGTLDIEQKTILQNNLSNSHNLNVNNTIHNKHFLIKNPLELNDIKIIEDLNIKNNITFNTITIPDKINIKKQLITKKNVILLPNKFTLDEYGALGFNNNTLNIVTNLNNNTFILNDSKGCENKSSITINNNTHDFNIVNNNTKNIDILNNSLNIYYNSHIKGNITLTNNISINNNTFINNNINIKNNVKLIDGYVKLPITNKIRKGAIRYNNNTNMIQVVYDKNKYEDLKFVDKNNTGIVRSDENILFNIKNNNIIEFKNDVNILNNVIFSNNLNISQNLNIHNNIYTSTNLNINNIPIQFYNGLLRTYNNNSKNFVSLTLEELNSVYQKPFISMNFYKINITNQYSNLFLNYYNEPSNILFNTNDLYNCEVIVIPVFLKYILINIIINNNNNNTYYLEIYKNSLLQDTIILANINNYINNYELKNIIYFNKNDILKIKVKKLIENDDIDSIFVNFQGYKNININTKGDSNYITEQYIYFNNNSSFNVNIDFKNNINVLNTFSNTNNINISRLSLNNTVKNSDLLNINNNFIINNEGFIGIGTNPNNNYLINIKSKNNSFRLNGNLNINKNYLNVYDLICNNININNNINTHNLLTDKLPLKDYILQENVNCLQNLNIIENININNSILTDKLYLNKYNQSLEQYYINKNNKIYLYENNNNLIYLNYNSIQDRLNSYIYHTGIINENNIMNIKNTIYIKKNNVSFFNNNNTNIFNINIDNNKYFSITSNNTIINTKVKINNINLNDKLKQILYDYYGPKEPFMSYDFRINNNIILYSYNNQNNIETNQYISYFEQNIKNNIILNKVNNIIYSIINIKPFYNNCGYNINLDIVYFTEIELINNNIKTFYNNIKTFKVNNSYNYNVTIYYYTNNIIYPKIYINKHNIQYIYGLKTEIK